jgi:hypothetical protein
VAEAAGYTLLQIDENAFMAKLTGTIRITTHAATDAASAHYEVAFVPYHGRVNGITLRPKNFEDLVRVLTELRLAEDEATRWAGKARAEGVVLIAGVERSEAQLRDAGLLA